MMDVAREIIRELGDYWVNHTLMFLLVIIDSHWSLIILDIVGSTYFHYDPKIGYHNGSSLMSIAAEFLSNDQRYFLFSSSNWKKALYYWPQQNDDVNCGIYVVHAAFSHSSQKVPCIDGTSAFDLRKKMFSLFYGLANGKMLYVLQEESDFIGRSTTSSEGVGTKLYRNGLQRYCIEDIAIYALSLPGMSSGFTI